MFIDYLLLAWCAASVGYIAYAVLKDIFVYLLRKRG